jgi:hypothetical protein
LSLNIKKLEEDLKEAIKAKDKMEVEVKAEEAKTMEFLFEKTRWEVKFQRHEQRIKELEAQIKAAADEANERMEQMKAQGIDTGGSGSGTGSGSRTSVFAKLNEEKDPMKAAKAAAGKKDGGKAGESKTKKERNLEAVIDGLEQVGEEIEFDMLISNLILKSAVHSVMLIRRTLSILAK